MSVQTGEDGVRGVKWGSRTINRSLNSLNINHSSRQQFIGGQQQF